MGAMSSHMYTTVAGPFRSPQTSQAFVARDFAASPACCCRVNHLGEWTRCLEHETLLAEMLSSTAARDSKSEEDWRDAAEDRSYVMLLRRFHAGEPPVVAFDDHSPGVGVPNRDFGYDEGWAEVFASTAPGGEVVAALINNEDEYAEQFALSDNGNRGRPRQRADSPLQADLTRSRFLEDLDSSVQISDDDSDYDSDGNEIFRLQLPVTSPLAQRRYLARDEDLKCVSREQRFQAEYDVGRKRGDITEADDLFRKIDWNQQSSTQKIDAVSPRTLPQALRAPGRKNAIVAGSRIEASRQAQNDEVYARMRATEGFQSFPSPPQPYAAFTADWNDDLVIVDTRSELQRAAQNEEIHRWVLGGARGMHLQAQASLRRFPSPPAYEWSIGTASDNLFDSMVEYL